MIGIAFTGSGKTLAFCLPLILIALAEHFVHDCPGTSADIDTQQLVQCGAAIPYSLNTN